MVYIIIAIVAVILIYVFSTYNNFVTLKNRVEEAFATMDVYLKKRWDLIPNLVETVKGYTKHEKETLENIVKLRSGSYNELSTDNKVEINNKLTEQLNKLMVVIEKYPELKANDNFKDLSDQLVRLEEEIANSRKYYNGTVRNLNDKVQMFPSNLVAKMFGFKSMNMFQANEAERENVSVKF